MTVWQAAPTDEQSAIARTPIWGDTVRPAAPCRGRRFLRALSFQNRERGPVNRRSCEFV